MDKQVAINILNEVLASLKMNANELASQLEMKRAQGLYDVLNPHKENVGVSKKLAEKITDKFPQFSKSWLLTGEGPMLKSQHTEARPVDNANFAMVPLVPISAQAGYPKGYGDQEYMENLPTIPVFVDRNYKGKYMVFEVSGDSMFDGTLASLCDGDKILCREVKRDLWRSKLHIRDWYFVIVCRTEGITVKQITHHDIERGIIHCHPLNPMFEDFELNLDENVAELYNVVKIVERNARI
jgi:SOS-response transcriptional repressor LexA